jgi:hypothetical protein
MKMKIPKNKFLGLALILSMGLACSQPDITQKSKKSESDSKEQAEVKKEKTSSLFPVVFAGSISIIQRVYLKKSE